MLVVAGTGAGADRLRAAAAAAPGRRRLPRRPASSPPSSSPPGRFGADVGAAIVCPVGAAVAAAAIAARRRRAGLLVIAAPFAAARPARAADLLSGANAHLTRSVLDAGGLGELGRRRPAPPAALGPQLRPPDRLRLPAADRRARRPRRRCAATGSRPGWRAARRCGPG